MRLDQNRDGVFNGQFRSNGKQLPILLNYSVDLKYNQSTKPTEQIHFKNPYSGPMWVDELHFVVHQPPTGLSDNPAVRQVIPVELMAMRMKLNNSYIVDEFVPLVLIAPHTDFSEIYVGEGLLDYSFFWRLARPLWVDELDDLAIELSWLPFNGYNPDGVDPATITMTVKVSLCGRGSINANRPKERYLPFHATWTPAVLEAGNVTTEYSTRSPDSALRNTRNTPVTITRMLGSLKTTPNLLPEDMGTNFIPTFLFNNRISHSAGYYLVKDLTPFYELFQNFSRVFDVKFVMQPKEFLTVEVQTTPFDYFPAGETPDIVANYLVCYSLQGYSVEALR